MSIPKTMHVIESLGHSEPDSMRWGERPMPQPADDEVLIRVAAAGINRADILQRQGNYPPPKGSTDILGLEVSGEVVAVGSKVTRWKTGDKICALLSGGGYAEFVTAPEDHCLPIPGDLSFTQAAALPECIVTVWANLFEIGGLQAGQTALVHGGSSGVGTFAIQMAKTFGAKIFITAGSDDKCAVCKKLGADLVINYKREGFPRAIQLETKKTQSIDVVLDMVGGDYVGRNLMLLVPGGKHISIAVQSDKLASIDLWSIMRHRLVLTGSTLRHRPAAEKARLMRAMEEKIWPLILAGKIKPLIYKTFPIKMAAQAHKLMESGAHIGKIVLEVTSVS